MSRTTVLPEGADLVVEVMRELRTHEHDLSRVAVVFQGRRPAHFLRKALAQDLQRPYFPPAIFSLDRFIDYLHESVFGSPVAELETLDALVKLYTMQSALQPAGEPAGVVGMDSYLPVGQRLFDALEELLIENISPQKLAAAVQDSPGHEQRTLLYYYERFHREVAEEGKTTRAMRHARVADAADRIALEGFQKVILAGFYRFTRTEQAIMQTLARRDHVVFVFVDGLGIGEQVRAIDPSARFPERLSVEPAITLSKASDLHGQIGGLARDLELLKQSGEKIDERTVIVLPSADSLFPVVEWALPCLGDAAHNISLGYPVRRTPLFAFVQSMMQVLESMDGDRVYLGDYVRFLLHPYVKNIVWRGSPEPTRIIAHALEEELAGTRARSFLTLEGIEHDPGLMTRVAFRLSHAGFEATAEDVSSRIRDLHERTLRPMQRATSVGACAAALAETIMFLEEKSTARLHPQFARFRNAVLDRLGEIERSRLGEISLRRIGEYWSVLSACLHDSVVPFEGTPVEGVQVLGFLETRNLHFDRVFILDVNDDVLPGGDGIDMFLPASLRRMVGLPEQADRDAVAEYWFDGLIRAAREVHLFYREGGKKERSRFVERLIWQWQQRDNTIDDARYVRNIEYTVRVVLPTPAPVMKVPEVIARLRHVAFSASALDAYLRCPLQFYYRHVLGMEEPATEQEDIEHAEIGKVVHTILMRYFRPYVGQVLAPNVLSEKDMRRVVRDVFMEEYGADISGPRVLLLDRTERKLVEFLHHYQMEVLRQTSVELHGVEVALQVERHGVMLKGRADRVERRGDTVYILDYKTGADAGRHRVRLDRVDFGDRAGWRKQIGSLQLPLYAWMYAEVHGLKPEGIQPAYLYLGRGGLNLESEESPFVDDLEPEGRLDLVNRVVGALIGEIMDPPVPFRGTDDVDGDCPLCPFVQVCGTRWAGGWMNFS